ncbi:MAG: hypothetical protein H8D78_06055 [Chloroflexi bacterium]|nr:hypothetical protein [Chloroflexota bacterium]
MEQINRGVVIIKPKAPFLEWVNRDPTLSSPISMQNLLEDCTVLLVPDLYSLEDMLDYLEPFKPLLFEMELAGWYLDPATWPAERTAEVFNAWFELEAHSMVWDVVDAPIEKESSRTIDVTGTWIVVSSPDLDDDYLYMETTPYVTLQQDGSEVSGEFQIGLIAGSLSGQLDGDRVWFSFEAMDEMDPVNGAGTITLQGKRLILKLMFHFGDEFIFECKQGA